MLKPPTLFWKYYLLFILFGCSSPTKDNNMLPEEPYAYFDAIVRETVTSADMHLEAKKEVLLGPNDGENKYSRFRYIELGKALLGGLTWTISSKTMTNLPQGVIYQKVIDGYEFRIDESSYVENTEFDAEITVKRGTTVLGFRKIKVSPKVIPTLRSATLRRNLNEITTGAFVGVPFDLKTVFDVSVVPTNSPNDLYWVSTSNTLGTVSEDGILTATDAGTINVNLISRSNSQVVSNSAPVVIQFANRTLTIKDFTFPTRDLPPPNPNGEKVLDLPSGRILVAWLKYRTLAGVDQTENLGGVVLTQDAMGNVIDPVFTVNGSKLLPNNTKFLITIETTPNAFNVADPSSELIFSGFVTFNLMDYPLTFLDNSEFNNSATNGTNSTYVLATPSDTPTDNDENGVWFVKDNDPLTAGLQPIASLNLPALPDTGTWVYEAWVVDNNTTISLGKFFSPMGADMSRRYYNDLNTTPVTPPFPGEDLLRNVGSREPGYIVPNPFPLDVRGKTIMITLELANEGNDTTPNFIKILETTLVNTDIGIDKDHALEEVTIPTATLEVK